MTQAPIAISILTGFLGAGKTTLLNRLLKDPELESTAVIINEFGEISIDHMLVEEASDGLIQLADGCLCCTVRGELVDTLADLIDRMQTGRIAPLKRIVIETTGLADPVPVLQAVMGHPVLMQALRLDGVICVVDAINATATLDVHEEAVRQVAVADRIVIAKADLADPVQLDVLKVRLGALNPNATLLHANAASATALIDCGLYDPKRKEANLARWLGETKHDDHHHHDEHCGHHHHHDDRVKTLSLVHPHPVSFAAIEAFLDILRSTQGEKLLRMKGVIELLEDPERPLVIHGVQKLLHPPARLAAWPEGPRGTRIVLITFDMPEVYVQRLFAAFMDAPAIDMPDRAALQDNPLAIAGYKA